MPNKANRSNFPKDKEVEVIMKKKMQYKDYLMVLESGKRKGWQVDCYQIGFRAETMAKKID